MREGLTPYRRANAILQKLGPSDKSYVLLVEGKTDRIFYGKFTISEDVQISPCDGHENVIEVVKILRDRDFNKFVGIIDADFRKIDEEEIEDERVFHTDFHDSEVSIIESRALNDILNKYGNEDKIIRYESEVNKSFKKALYDVVKPIGYLRWANKKKELGLAFKPQKPDGNPLKYHRFVSKRFTISEEEMVNYILQYSKGRGKSVSTKEQIEEAFEESKKSKVDLRQLCNGHDLCFVLALALKQTIGSSNVGGTVLHENILFAYDSQAFKETALYKALKDWEKANNIQLFI